MDRRHSDPCAGEGCHAERRYDEWTLAVDARGCETPLKPTISVPSADVPESFPDILPAILVGEHELFSPEHKYPNRM
jgi:hypothetical protein